MSAAQPTDAVVASATPTTVAASTTAVTAATTPATTAGEPVTPTKTPMPPKEKRPEGGPKTPKSKDVIINTQEIPGGGKIEMRANGSILQTNADGSTIETWKDSERRHETTPNGDWMEVKEDGTHIQYSNEQKVKISKFKNGSELQENDDGSTIETDSEGMIIEKMGNIYIEIRTDGSRLQKDGETGISIEKFGDGTTVQTMPDHTRIVRRPNGHATQRNPNGTVIETWKDGRRVQTSLDGVRIEKFANGRTVQTDSSGTIIEKLADGTLLPPRQPKLVQKCVSCSKCTTIISIPNDTFVVCCPMCRHIMLGHQINVIGSGKTAAESKTKKVQWGTHDDSGSEVKTIFDRYDVNGSGGIDQTEVGNMLKDLNFPPTEFAEIFMSADDNSDGELQFHEFVEYFNELNSAILATAKPADLSMSAQMMEDQKAELSQAKEELVRMQKILEEKLSKATINNCDDLANEKRKADEQIVVIEAELKLREKHFETAVKEQHKRRHDALQAKLQARKDAKAK